jgi:hypothetical protein
MRKPVFYHIHVSGKYVECWDYLCNARTHAKELTAKGEHVEIITSDGRSIRFKGQTK